MGEFNGVEGGVSSFVSSGFKPWWHGLEGTVDFQEYEEGTLTPRKAYEEALNWKVSLTDLYVMLPDSDGVFTKRLVPGKKATIKTDDQTVLGVVSHNYGITQNEVLCDFAEALKSHGDVRVTSAGSLFDHRQVWMLAQLGEDKHFADGDETIQRYLLLSSGHDGTLALSARPTNVRVECMNTFTWAMRDSSLVTLRHTANVDDRLAAARQVISKAYDHWSQIDNEIEMLLNSEYSRTMFQDYLVPKLAGEKPDDAGRALTAWENRRDGLIAAYERPDQRNIEGTAWGAVMAVNSYEQWSVRLRGTDRSTMQARKALRGDYPLTQQARTLVLA